MIGETGPMNQSKLKREQILEHAKNHESKTQGEIAEACNTSRGYVNSVLNEHHPDHPSVGGVKEQILEYADENLGGTQREIVDATGASRSRVADVLAEHRPKYSQWRVSDATEQKIRGLASQTPLLSIREIIEKSEAHRRVVRRCIRDMEEDR